MNTVAWLNGKYVEQALISLQGNGLLLADGLFETIRVEEENGICDFYMHMDRLWNGLEAFGISCPYSPKDLFSAASGLVSQFAFKSSLARLRITLSRAPNQAMVLITLEDYFPNRQKLYLVPTDVIRTAGNPTSRFKTLAYTDAMHAQRMVNVEGQNNLALMKNQWGRVACASVGNIFVCIDGKWITPATTEGALPGISRAKLLSSTKYQGLDVLEGKLHFSQLYGRPLLFTNVLRGIVPAYLRP